MIIEVLTIGAAAFIGITIVTAGWGIGTYNTMIVAFNDVKNQWSNVKTEYQRRADLIVSMVESVKGYAKHERATLFEVMQVRNGNFGKTKAEEMKKLKGFDQALHRLLMVQEAYPELKANDTFLELMDELKVTENRVNIARTDYNETVRDYNILLTVFPKNIIAGIFHFVPEQYFELQDAGSERAPKVSF